MNFDEKIIFGREEQAHSIVEDIEQRSAGAFTSRLTIHWFCIQKGSKHGERNIANHFFTATCLRDLVNVYKPQLEPHVIQKEVPYVEVPYEVLVH
ncbi:UDP-N-acetylhexosamine pyrophosphorylase [Galemys pyrenaicus]|uniref:UDP-N-acetylhexosamine pyrophosphorylase n=1 Tax=Galemys pyrenaicus TaxID=202257 RepID=A0A8J6ABI4_GALPY|nr:UDP-N-acetylhexosamine pyrophosphorylase [Galemys pyrenaicus]